MLIDWFTVGAQALNFLILVWLMKRFLYKPILHAIDAREQRIAKELADADAKKAEAQKEHEEFQHKNEVFDQQRATLLSQATDEAKAERQRLLDEARQAADALRVKRQDALQREQQSLNEDLTRRTQEEVFAIARKTLTDLADASLEDRMSEVFTRRLHELGGGAKEEFTKSMATSSGPVLVRSAFELPPDQRTKIQNALNEAFSADVPARFETEPSVIGGIELIASGRKVAWSIANYLVSLEANVGELLKDQPQSPAKPATNTKFKPQSGPTPATSEEPK